MEHQELDLHLVRHLYDHHNLDDHLSRDDVVNGGNQEAL